MFRFKELALFGWDLWPSVRIPLDREVVIVTGPNGSGKTTLLDAFRQLLNARSLSSRRHLQHYLRRPGEPALLRAVVSNRGRDALSVPFRRERIQTPEVTLACALVPAGGGSPEKRFAVLPGRTDPRELKRVLLDSREWVGPERYGRILAHAGVTRSLMGVLAIEQGRTNSLFELRPRQLFQRVLDMLGDRAVLDRYRAARRRYEDSEREVARQADALSIRQADLQRVLREVSKREEWEQAGERVRDLEARLPAAELQVSLRERREAAAKIPELTTKVRRGDAERIRLEEEVRELRGGHSGAEAAHDLAREAEQAADTERVRAERAEAAVLERLEKLEARRAEAEAIPPGDGAILEAAAEEADRAFHRLVEEGRAVKERIAALAERVRRLEEGLPVWPEAVERCLRELYSAGIVHALLAEKVEPRDPALAEAVEAALGDARYALLVPPESERAAVEVARRCRFPGPVYAGPGLDAPRDVPAVSLLTGAPAWVPDWLSGVRLGPDGMWTDRRGTWTAGPDGRVLGTTGRKAALAEARDRLLAARAEGKESERRRARAREAREEARGALERERRRRRLLEEAAALPEAREEAKRLREAADLARAASREAREAREAAEQEKLETALALSRAEERALEQGRKLEGERSGLAELQARAARLDEAIGAMTPGIPPGLRKRAEAGELDGPDTVRGDLERARRRLEALGEPPPPEVREEARHLEANVEELERHVRERRRESEEARTELAECRKRYLEIVAEALRGYRRRVQGLSEIAEVEVEMELPRLTDEDRSLDEAEIQARFGFDGKDPLPVGDPSFSGGQQVIVGLVLLMGMAETDGEGFFMLDEPFAHLSLDRVDQVGRFLRGTRSQFILTAPTTLDRAQLDPASLVVVLGKKRAGEVFAPVPIVAEA